ncbi:hypothetical protein CU661_30080, partial [Pseudomonas syringae pv. actinidifoliorum]|nr:hypothetical protein [Pseudomonas syringae pv. actinidifoliorum]
GVYFSQVKNDQQTDAISGAAESNNRVSDLMRNLEASDWLEAPSLTEVKATTAGAVDQANVFQLTVRQTQPPVAAVAPAGATSVAPAPRPPLQEPSHEYIRMAGRVAQG